MKDLLSKPLNIKLEKLEHNNPDHVGWIYKVRAHPEVAKYFFAPPPTKFIDHVRFLERCHETKERQFFILQADEQLCGYCQIINHPDSLEVGFALHPDFWGKGMGSTAVDLLFEEICKNCLPPKRITLRVRKTNERALKLYKKHGFVVTDSDDAQDGYVMELKS